LRVWDLPPADLCRQHLLGQHNEIHALWTVITQNRAGYANHPETQRWRTHLRALYNVHNATADEMTTRNYNHRSPLDESQATGSGTQTDFVDSIERQRELLKEKGCRCFTTSGGQASA
jgi:Pyrimidine dimer DNA glycosylase